MSVISLWKEIKRKIPKRYGLSDTLDDGLIHMFSKLIAIIAAMILLVTSAEFFYMDY